MKKRLLPFGKKLASTSTESQPAPAPIPSLSIYQSIDKLPLHRFVDCIVDNNLHSLVIEGKPTELQLQEAWNNILSEYTEAIGNHEYRIYISLYKEISLLKLSYNQIITSIEMLRVVYSEYLCQQLNNLLKTSCKFNYKDQNSYQEELSKCLRRSKSIKISIDLKVLQFDAIQKKHFGKEEQKYTRGYFDSILINLSDHAKYEIHESITVSKYCERIKRFNKYIETLKNRR